MAKTQTKGKCEVCGHEYARSGMAKHLEKCLLKNDSPVQTGGKQPIHPILHLQIVPKYGSDYWLNVELAPKTQFADLDHFLRGIWLECCGHMSAFRMPRPKRPSSKDDILSMIDSMRNFEDVQREEDKLMKAKIGDLLKVGDEIEYDYDFGSTTELKIKVLSQRKGFMKTGVIRILARNNAPDLRCSCGQPATEICTECMCEVDFNCFLCEKCAESHECGEEMFLPVVNSPRMGVCGYTGPQN